MFRAQPFASLEFEIGENSAGFLAYALVSALPGTRSPRDVGRLGNASNVSDVICLERVRRCDIVLLWVADGPRCPHDPSDRPKALFTTGWMERPESKERLASALSGHGRELDFAGYRQSRGAVDPDEASFLPRQNRSVNDPASIPA